VTAKLTETICFAGFVIFHIYLIQTYFKSKYSKKTLIFALEYWRIQYSIVCIPRCGQSPSSDPVPGCEEFVTRLCRNNAKLLQKLPVFNKLDVCLENTTLCLAFTHWRLFITLS